jgi:signal transduction histidine kinase
VELGAGWVAFTFIRSGGEPIGVMTNDTAISRRPPNDTTQEATALYCSLLGHIVKRLSDELEREELITELEAKNAELERFTYTVSHDLKSPLITIRGFVGFLERDVLSGDVERLRADIARISEASARMQRLLDELLQLSRVGRLLNPPEPVPLGDVVADALALVEGRVAKRGVRIQVADDLPVLRGDRARLVEVVQNLLDNAVKFLGDEPEPLVEVGVEERDGCMAVFVRDNGPGIEPRFQQRIFGLFNKLDAQSDGTGVGLALAKRIVEVHGGRIWVESEGRAGRGATFWFSVPAAPATGERKGEIS